MRAFDIDHSLITCDRMIPLRDCGHGDKTKEQERESHSTFQIKQEIESAPPEFLNEDKRLEQQPNSNNNTIQDQNHN